MPTSLKVTISTRSRSRPTIFISKRWTSTCPQITAGLLYVSKHVSENLAFETPERAFRVLARCATLAMPHTTLVDNHEGQRWKLSDYDLNAFT